MADYILGTLPNFYYPGSDGILSGHLPNFDGDVLADQHLNAVYGELPNFSGELEGITNQFGIVSGSLLNFTGEIDAKSGRAIALSGTFPNFTGSITAVPHKIAVVSGSLPNFTGSIAAQFVSAGTILGTLPNFTGNVVSLGTYYVLSVNMANRGVTEYSNYAFNSFFEYEGKYYGVTSTGIYLLEGTTDAGTVISAYITGGKGNMGSSTVKAITDVFALTNVNGNLTLNLKADDTATGQTYTFTGNGALKNRRWPCALGVTGQEWQWKVSNVAGADFEIRRLELIAARTNRR
jgi:hypothetical protein